MACVSLFTPGFYGLESIHWQAQSIGQDMVDVALICPILLIFAFKAFHGRPLAKSIWAGTNIYLVYTFAIYTFDVHFNMLFPFYCLSLGLAFYSVVYFLYTEIPIATDQKEFLANTHRIIGIYFIVTSILFYILWLSDILTSIWFHILPQSISDAGLPTNPVHVIDLAIILPGMFMTGLFLLRRHPLGLTLAPAMLVFTLLMNLTIAGLTLVMLYRGLKVNWIVAAVMGSLAVFNFILLWPYWKVQRQFNSTSHGS